MLATICLIGPGHAASTPRLVKNANALAEAGYRVHVVAGRHYAPVDPLDGQVFAAAKWPVTLVDYRGGIAVRVRRLLRRFARLLVVRRTFATVGFAARAHHAEVFHLAARAARIPADLYLGHSLAGLPAAAAAARSRGAGYGFDAEDFHDGETEDAIRSRPEFISRRVLQAGLLPGCVHLTAASPLIAAKCAELYGVRALPLLNVFPLSDAPAESLAAAPISAVRPARLYWFSQTIGPGRGLEQAVAFASRMRTPVELHLRGFVSDDYKARLQAHAFSVGLKRPVIFLPPAPPAEMVRLAANADLGLSLEQSHPQNRDLCLTNKIFAYLLAGIPQLLSATKAQTALAPELGSAALVDDLRDPEASAHLLDAFFGEPERVNAARRAAWNLARRTYCWDVEKKVLLESIAVATGAVA